MLANADRAPSMRGSALNPSKPMRLSPWHVLETLRPPLQGQRCCQLIEDFSPRSSFEVLKLMGFGSKSSRCLRRIIDGAG
jgi:hypothetical protein